MALDTDNCTWIDLAPATTPPARSNHATWWDENRGSWIIHAGSVNSGFFTPPSYGMLNDMWEYAAGDVEDWQPIYPATNPGYRMNMAYAFGGPPGDRVAMMVGGRTPASVAYYQSQLPSPPGPGVAPDGGYLSSATQETWIYDGTDWTQLHPANPPLAEWQGQGTYPNWAGLVWSDHFNMWIYTALHQFAPGLVAYRIVTYGYYDDDWHIIQDGGNHTDGWHAIGDDWNCAFTNHQMLAFGNYVYHAGRASLTTPPGVGTLQQVIRWHGTRWDRANVPDDGDLVTAHAPLHREGFCWCFDGVKGLLFSGDLTTSSSLGTPSDQQTWSFDGVDWTQFVPEPIGVRPPKRFETGFVWDEERNRALVFGGTNPDDFTAYDDTWELISVPTPVPPPNLHLAPFRVPINNVGVPRIPTEA